MNRLFPTTLRATALLLCGALLPAAVAAESALQPFDAVYEVRIKGLRGEMTMSLKADADSYAATSTLRARGLASLIIRGRIEENAEFDVAALRLVPQDYRSSNTLGSNDESIDMRFDWQEQRATGQEDGEEFEHDAVQDSYDRVTLQYGLMLDLLEDRLAESYVLLDGATLKDLTVSNRGEQRIEVPHGTFDVIGVSHRSGNSSRITTLWCAPELGFLPVRIEQHRDGKLNVRAELAEYVPATPSMGASQP